MACITIITPNGTLDGHLIEDKAYCRARDLAEMLGFNVSWQPNTVTVSQKPRPIAVDTDLRLPSFATPDLLDKYMDGTPLAGLGKTFVDAEAKWCVNAVFACAVACHESNFGRSQITQAKKNLFGFMAYDRDPYGSAKKYSTFQESIEDFCKLISREYLNPGGDYYNGPTIPGVGKRYASDPKWAEKVLQHCQAILA